MAEITKVGNQSGSSFLPMLDKIVERTLPNIDYRSSLEQCADAHEAEGQGCCQCIGSWFMKVIDCILVPFKVVIEWIFCCCPKPPKEVASEFSENLKKNLNALLHSFKTLEQNEKNLKEMWNAEMLPYIGTQYEEMAKIGSELREERFAQYDETIMRGFPAFEYQANELASWLNYDRILETLSAQILSLISSGAVQQILTQIAHGNSDLFESFKNPERALGVLKENHPFRTLVIEQVFKVYLKKFNVDNQQFPMIAALYSVLHEILQDANGADEWTKVLLEEAIKSKKLSAHFIPERRPPSVSVEDQNPVIQILSIRPASRSRRHLVENYMTLHGDKPKE